MSEMTFKVAYDSKTNLYAFKTTYDNTLEINRKPVVDPLLGFKSGEVFVLNEPPTVATRRTVQTIISHYVNKETEEVMSVEEYNKIVAKIDNTRTYNNDYEYTYSTVEDEVFATRFFRTYSKVYKNVETIHDLQIEIINYPVSEYPNIVPLYSISRENIYETKCTYYPKNIDTFYQVCATYGIEKNRISIATHSGIEYAKIDDNYLTGAAEFEKYKRNAFTGTYEECVKRMKSDADAISSMIELHLAKHSKKTIHVSTLGHLVTTLVKIQRELNSLNVKRSDQNSLIALNKAVSNLIDIYKKTITP
jgi:hypothetical protein